MQGQALDVSAYAGGYIAETASGEVVSEATAEELERALKARGYTEETMPAIESVPPSGLNIF
jgi:hypothetical protein